VRAFAGTRLFSRLRTVVLTLLVTVMGFRIGRSETVIRSFGTLGLTALAFAAATVAGTAAVLLLVGMFRPRFDEANRSPIIVPWYSLLRDPALLLLALAAGLAVGRIGTLAPGSDGSVLISWVLYALLLTIGVSLGASGIRVGEVITHPDLFLVPLGTLAGTLLGGLAAGILLHIRAGTSLSLAAGLGWYSLSGVILTRLDGPAIGAVAFLSNMLRESMALFLIPLLGRSRFPLLAIGVGGATSMDVTLPLIERSCGPRAVPFAMASGGFLSLMVPILVPLLSSL
jgi:uncharacterized membrane protein YbjE (DUF340 family)